ncbi:MAG: hypothetical protein H0V51_23305 [Chloroflexi bacterium]|nr:hypothetical protein [Chloroflexota bacterium]
MSLLTGSLAEILPALSVGRVTVKVQWRRQFELAVRLSSIARSTDQRLPLLCAVSQRANLALEEADQLAAEAVEAIRADPSG